MSDCNVELIESTSQQPPQSNDGPRPVAEEQVGRVWRACLECRKRKNKCDGKATCKPCRTKDRECIYPETNDNASTSRQLATTIEARCQQLEALCQKMETMMGDFSKTIENFSALTRDCGRQHLDSPIPAAPTPFAPQDSCSDYEMNQELSDEISFPVEPSHLSPLDEPNEHPDRDDGDEESSDELPESVSKKAVDHVMAIDSYGKLRFVGGTSNMIMIEALKNMSPSSGIVSSPAGSPVSRENTSVIELPFFTRGQVWPRLPSLAQPEQLARPPRYISDLLVNIYFERLHYTMPVLYRPHFMQRYNLLLNAGSSSKIDAGFLSVFFAVCTCASGLLPRETGNSSVFTGFQYYESAISLHYASTGEGSIEQVQCLALLSMCSAGWNTLAQSWKFAGQAVRAAQDLGLHRSPARGTGEILKEELCRRIWWSVYGLDRILSNCLGRPPGVEDSDCDCEMPLDMEDGDLEAYSKQDQPITPKEQSPSRLTGFIIFSRLCQISGRISRSMSTFALRHNRVDVPKSRQLRELVSELDTELAEWLQNVPDIIRFSANETDVASPHLSMCVISYILHAGCIINLHRPLIPDDDNTSSSSNPSTLQCVNAARSCIQVAELIKENVPPSHHLSYCTHYLALSGIFILKSLNAANSDTNDIIEACIRCLADLKNVSVSAHRSSVILEELLAHSKSSRTLKRPYSEFEDFSIAEFMMVQDLFPGLN